MVTELLRRKSNKGLNIISLQYNADDYEAEKIIWYTTEMNHNSTAIKYMSDSYNLSASDFTSASTNTFEHNIESGVYMSIDEYGELVTSALEQHLGD